MAVISSGLVPKTLAPGLGGSPVSSAAVGQGPGQQAPRARQRAVRPSSGGLLRAIKKAAKAQLAGHNCGGSAHHDGSPMAHPVGRR
jgi:hypothetical protein